MSDELKNKLEATWKHLCESGRLATVELASNQWIEAERPNWFDGEKFALARRTIQKYYIGLNYSSFTGLLLILQLPDGLEPLLVTGNSKDIPSLYKRYLSTVLHIKSWYEDDVFDPSTKGYKSIRQVRSMHRRVQQLMNERFQTNDVDGKARTWMSQYDVAMTQFAFIGLAMLYPHKCGMIAASEQELEQVNYYWRVLGWLMGMQDQFNCCQFDSFAEIKQFMGLIFEREYLANFAKYPCPIGLEMTRAICLALSYYLPLMTFNQLANWWSEIFNFNGYQPQPMTGREKLIDWWTQLTFKRFMRNEKFLSLSTKLHKRSFERRLKNRDKAYESLCKKYNQDERYNFASDRKDYFQRPNAQEASKKDADLENNNNNDEPQSCRANKLQQLTTFEGCPMGYAATLPQVA